MAISRSSVAEYGFPLFGSRPRLLFSIDAVLEGGWTCTLEQTLRKDFP